MLTSYGLIKSYPKLEKEIRDLMIINSDCSETVHKESLTLPSDITNNAYSHGCYHPSGNIFFIPLTQGVINKWHYYNIATNKILDYTNPFYASISVQAYIAYFYDYKYNRIILVPNQQTEVGTTAHYIDTTSIPPRVVQYDASLLTGKKYTKGIYDSSLNRLYLIPLTNTVSGEENYIYWLNLGSSVTVSRELIASDEKIWTSTNGIFGGFLTKNGTIYTIPFYDDYFKYFTLTNYNTIYHLTGVSLPYADYNFINGCYIPHLDRIYLNHADSSSKIYYFNTILQTLSEIETGVTIDMSTDRQIINGLNGRLYYIKRAASSTVNVRSFNINTNTITDIPLTTYNVKNDIKWGYVTLPTGVLMEVPHPLTSTSGTIDLQFINLNLKVKPSQILMLSGLIDGIAT